MASSSSTAWLEARGAARIFTQCLNEPPRFRGLIMIDFVISAVEETIRSAIKQSGVIKLTLTDHECFAQALLSPPPSVAALKRAVARRKKLVSMSE